MSDYARILVTTDFSAQSLPGVEHAAILARKFESEIALVFVAEDSLPPLLGLDDREQILERHRERAAAKLADYAGEHLAGTSYHTVALAGSASQEIVRYAREHEVDLIVMASRGYGPIRQLLLGSTAERVLHHSPCPVLLVPSKGR